MFTIDGKCFFARHDALVINNFFSFQMISTVTFNILKAAVRIFRSMMYMVPGVSYVNNRIEDIKVRSNEKIKRAKGTALRGGIFIFSMGVILWLAIFIYVAFYYMYMPALSHVRPVHIQFKTCEDADSTDSLICSFPTSHIELTKKQQFLMVGQSYKIYLTFEMPESEANKNLGMFMVCLELNDHEGALVAHSCRSAMLYYRSWLLRTIKTLVMSPMLILGTSEEKQIITVEMFSDYEEDQKHPVTDMYVEIKTKKIELYSSSLWINAHFTGLRYLMFNWPILSAIFGIGINLFFILFILLLSWYHLFSNENGANYYTEMLRDNLCSPVEQAEEVKKKGVPDMEEVPSDIHKAPQLPKPITSQVFIIQL